MRVLGRCAWLGARSAAWRCAAAAAPTGFAEPAAPLAGSCGVTPALVVGGAGPMDFGEVSPRGAPGPAQPPGSGPEITVLVVYTPAAREAAGGRDALESMIADWFVQTNQFYGNSLVGQTVRLVGLAETAYVESVDAVIDLSRLREPADGFMDEAHALRDRVGADLVHLASVSRNVCGVAYLLTRFGARWSAYGFGLTNINCGSGTFAHELGHNMGCAHERGDGTFGAYCFSHGYTTPDGRFRDIMANALGGQRVGVFSSPLVSVNGHVMGRPATGSLPCAGEDAAWTLNLTAPAIAGFRSPADPPPAPDAFALVSPAPEAIGVPTSPTLGWRFSNGAERYDVTLSENADLSFPLLTATLRQGVGPLRVAVPAGLLLPRTTYYVRVDAVNAAGSVSATGGVARFRTRPPGDATGDGVVNFLDINVVLSQFFESGAPGSLAGDVNADGVVNFLDLNLVLANYGTS